MKLKIFVSLNVIFLILNPVIETKLLKAKNSQVPPTKEENIEMDTEDIFDYGDNEIGEEEIQKMLEISKENYMFDFSAGFLSTFLKNIKKEEIKKEIYEEFPKHGKCTKKRLEHIMKEGKIDHSNDKTHYQKVAAEQISKQQGLKISEVLNKEKDLIKSAPIEMVMNTCFNEKEKNIEEKQNLEKESSELKSSQKYIEALKELNQLIKKKKTYNENIQDAYWYIGDSVIQKRASTFAKSKSLINNALHKSKELTLKIKKVATQSTLENIKGTNEEKIKQYLNYINEKKQKIANIDKEILQNQVIVFNTKRRLEKIKKRIETLSSLADIDCVQFAVDPDSGYNFSLFRKTLNKLPFFAHVMKCGFNSEKFQDDLYEMKDRLSNIVENNIEIISGFVADELGDALKGVLLSTAKGVFYFGKFIKAISEKKKNCFTNGAPECAYSKGVVQGYAVRLVLALAGF